MDVLEILENHEARLRKLEKKVEDLILNGGGGGGGGGLLTFNSIANFPATGVAGFIYLETSTGIQYYWNGSQYVAIKDTQSYVLNQSAVSQNGGFRLNGSGVIGSLRISQPVIGADALSITGNQPPFGISFRVFPNGVVNLSNIIQTASSNTDLSPVNGALFYRADTHKLRVALNGMYHNVATEDSGAFIHNQEAAAQPANFWIGGRGRFSATGTEVLHLEQTNPAVGAYIRFTTPVHGDGYLVYGSDGDPNKALSFFRPGDGTEWHVSKGKILINAFEDGAGATLTLKSFSFAKAADVTSFAAGPKAIIIYDDEFDVHRMVIKPNGNWIIGGPFNDNGARFQIRGGALSLEQNNADYPVIDGGLYYNISTNKFRACINGVWQNLITEAEVQANYAPMARMKFIPSSPYTVLPADDGQILVWGSAGPCTVNAALGLRQGWQAEFWQDSGSPITFADAGGASIHSRGELKDTAGQYAAATLCHLAGGQFRLAGDLA